MKAVIIFACLFAVAFARPNNDAQIVRQDSDVGPESYSFALETSDGTKKEESGQLKDIGTDHEGIVVKGSFSFNAADGKTYTVNYVADENGFHPQGAHLPVAPVP